MTGPLILRPEDDPNNNHLRLSAQRALLGAISPSVKWVSVSYRDRQIVFLAAVDAGATDEEREALDVAAGEIIADYVDPWIVEVTVSESAGTPPGLPELVYLRRGDIPER